MHPEADALLDAIFDNPDDDTPRLVYADWLQEHGQEDYAQFIRFQCAAAREDRGPHEVKRFEREIGLLWKHLIKEWQPATRAKWLVTEREWATLNATHFHRGLLRQTIPIAAGLLARCVACWAWMPHSDNVLIVLPNDDTEALADSTNLRRVRVVRCGDLSVEPYAPMLSWHAVKRVRPKSIDPLLRSSHLSGVHTLDLSRVPARRSTVELLLTAPNLASVKELQFGFDESNECDPNEVIPLLKKRFSRVHRW